MSRLALKLFSYPVWIPFPEIPRLPIGGYFASRAIARASCVRTVDFFSAGVGGIEPPPQHHASPTRSSIGTPSVLANAR
jgi:hypothetical protein